MHFGISVFGELDRVEENWNLEKSQKYNKQILFFFEICLNEFYLTDYLAIKMPNNVCPFATSANVFGHSMRNIMCFFCETLKNLIKILESFFYIFLL